MYIDEHIYSSRPASPRTDREMEIYDFLDKCQIPYWRIDHDHADTMEDCRLVESVLKTRICKNLLLCNRQQTDFYLLMMPGDKTFKTKFLSGALGCSRLSFASPEIMEQYLKTSPGSVSALELINDTGNHIQLVIDKELVGDEYISGHPCISTSTVKLYTEDFLKIFLPAIHHTPVLVELASE